LKHSAAIRKNGSPELLLGQEEKRKLYQKRGFWEKKMERSKRREVNSHSQRERGRIKTYGEQRKVSEIELGYVKKEKVVHIYFWYVCELSIPKKDAGVNL